MSDGHFFFHFASLSSVYLWRYFTPDTIVCKSIINQKCGVLWKLYVPSLIYIRTLLLVDVFIVEFSVSTLYLCNYCKSPCGDDSTVVHHSRENHRNRKLSIFCKLSASNEYRALRYNKNACDLPQNSSIYHEGDRLIVNDKAVRDQASPAPKISKQILTPKKERAECGRIEIIQLTKWEWQRTTPWDS